MILQIQWLWCTVNLCYSQKYRWNLKQVFESYHSQHPVIWTKSSTSSRRIETRYELQVKFWLLWFTSKTGSGWWEFQLRWPNDPEFWVETACLGVQILTVTKLLEKINLAYWGLNINGKVQYQIITYINRQMYCVNIDANCIPSKFYNLEVLS